MPCFSVAVDEGSLSASGTGSAITIAGGLTLGVTPTATFVSGQPYYFGEGYNVGSLGVSGGASVAVAGARDVSEFGGWRAYVKSLTA